MKREDARRLRELLYDDARGALRSDEKYREMLRLREEWEASPSIDGGRMTRAQRDRLDEISRFGDEADELDEWDEWKKEFGTEFENLLALSMAEDTADELEWEIQHELARNDASAVAGRTLSARYRRAYAAYVEKFGDQPHYYRLCTTEMLCDAMEHAIATGRELACHPGAIG